MIVRTIDVRVSPETAFAVWTERIDLWWPPAHRRSGRPGDRLTLEPGVGGAFSETTRDGARLDYGRVLAWDPPRSLSLAFYPGTGPEVPTRVDVRFEPVEDGTRVRVEHTAGSAGSDRFGARAATFDTNWRDVLTSFLTVTQPPDP